MQRLRALALTLVALAAVAAGCAAPTATGPKPTVRVGSANFTEQIVLGELYGQVLEANGYPIERKLNLGPRDIVAPAMDSAQIDLVPEYLATYVVYRSGGDTSKADTDAQKTHRSLQDALKDKNLTVLDYAPAVDTNALVVTKATADRLGLKKTSDLARHNGQLVLGGPPTCPERPFCLIGFDRVYGLKFKEFKPLDTGGPLTVAALEGNQIDVALLFSTNAAIQAKGFVLLEDDKKLQLADNVAPVVRNDLLNRAPSDFRTLLNGVSAKLTTEELTGLNKQVDLDRKDAKEVAAAWLKAKGLVR